MFCGTHKTCKKVFKAGLSDEFTGYLDTRFTEPASHARARARTPAPVPVPPRARAPPRPVPVQPKKPAKKRKYTPRGKLPGALHTCKGLPLDTCDVAPNCFWSPATEASPATKTRPATKARRAYCATYSGEPVMQKFYGEPRQSMLKQLRGQYTE